KRCTVTYERQTRFRAARAPSRAGDDAIVIANFPFSVQLGTRKKTRTFSRFRRLFRRGAETSTRGRVRSPESFSHVGWQQHSNRCSLAPLAFGFNTTAVQLRDVFDNGETEAGPALLPTARLVGAIEPFEDARQIFFVYPDPVVTHAQRHFFSALFDPQLNLAVFRRILHGVV